MEDKISDMTTTTPTCVLSPPPGMLSQLSVCVSNTVTPSLNTDTRCSTVSTHTHTHLTRTLAVTGLLLIRTTLLVFSLLYYVVLCLMLSSGIDQNNSVIVFSLLYYVVLCLMLSSCIDQNNSVSV